MPQVDPSEILAAGSLVGVAITPAQAEAVAAQLLVYDLPTTPCRGLDAWRIPSRENAYTDANAPGVGPLEIHFHYLPEEPQHVESGHVGLEVTVYRPDGSVSDSQDYG
jgi:hypothetical protein